MEWYELVIFDLIMIIRLLISYDYDIMTTWLVIMKVVRLNRYMGSLNKLG
jgi:hypothetical protein